MFDLKSFPPHPSPLPQGGEGKGSRSPWVSNPEFDLEFAVSNPEFDLEFAVSNPEFDLNSQFQILSATRYFRSAYLEQSARSVPSPSGRGLG
jgi:hypothetical protein